MGAARQLHRYELIVIALAWVFTEESPMAIGYKEKPPETAYEGASPLGLALRGGARRC